MKSFSNTYIFIFSAVMVILVAALLSFLAMQLKPVQDLNVKIETMQNILKSVQVPSTKKNAEELFNKYIVESYVINSNNTKLEYQSAIGVDMKKEVAKLDKIKSLSAKLLELKESPFKKYMSGIIISKSVDKVSIKNQIDEIEGERLLPVYVCEKDGVKFYVFPLRGKGLWGPIWGYISLESDMNTVYGAVFDHKSETPGLGAEINQDWFQKNFAGKKIFNNDSVFESIKVVKGGADKNDLHGVDAVSGGTITSKGVQSMIYDCLGSYQPFFEKQRN